MLLAVHASQKAVALPATSSEFSAQGRACLCRTDALSFASMQVQLSLKLTQPPVRHKEISVLVCLGRTKNDDVALQLL